MSSSEEYELDTVMAIEIEQATRATDDTVQQYLVGVELQEETHQLAPEVAQSVTLTLNLPEPTLPRVLPKQELIPPRISPPTSTTLRIRQLSLDVTIELLRKTGWAKDEGCPKPNIKTCSVEPKARLGRRWYGHLDLTCNCETTPSKQHKQYVHVCDNHPDTKWKCLVYSIVTPAKDYDKHIYR
ncbi:hypothetical protein LY76DRAFT_631726 [Colletotrichum caudatum]|nr:hypothetical protein LY76DRAFT_631726 [Colletotrichum caudatum]